jgi:hypothetical protein
MAKRNVVGRIERLEEFLGVGNEAPTPLTIEVVFVSADGESTPGFSTTFDSAVGEPWNPRKRWAR